MMPAKLLPSRFRISFYNGASSSSSMISDTNLGLLKATHDRIRALEEISGITSGDVERLSLDRDLVLGKTIGSGSFCRVLKVRRQGCDDENNYALKQLKPAIVQSRDAGEADGDTRFFEATVDFGLEAKILSSLKHPNIIKLHAVPCGSISRSLRTGKFFMVLDFLEGTLDKRMERWISDEKRQKRQQHLLQISSRSAALSKRNHLLDRLENVAMGVARALEHCHSLNIIYRDLKPNNIGFDENGVVKIFDFGLARECTDETNLEPREMTGCTGTPRYMAPEVTRRENYSFPADVYSYCIILWEVITLKKAFQKLKSLAQFRKDLVEGHVRPSMQHVHSWTLCDLLKSGWSDSPDDRPGFADICKTFQRAIEEIRDDESMDRSSRSHSRGRSRSRKMPLMTNLRRARSDGQPLEDDSSAGRRWSLGRRQLFFGSDTSWNP